MGDNPAHRITLSEITVISMDDQNSKQVMIYFFASIHTIHVRTEVLLNRDYLN